MRYGVGVLPPEGHRTARSHGVPHLPPVRDSLQEIAVSLI